MKNIRCFLLIHLLFLLVQTSISENRLTGKVIDRSDDPVEGAIVKLHSSGRKVVTSDDGTFEFEMAGTLKRNSNARNNIGIRNGILFIQNTALQNITLDLFDLNGRRICVLQNGKLKPGSYRFPIPSGTGNRVLLLRSRIGSRNQVYKLMNGSGMASVSNEFSVLDWEQTSADAPFDQLTVTHQRYDDVTVGISNYQMAVTVRMPHYKLSFERLNEIKIGDTLYNSSKKLALVLDSLADSRCCCSCLCEEPGEMKLYLTLNVNDQTSRIQFTVPGAGDTTIAGLKLVLNKITPTCPSNGDRNYQSYLVSLGISQTNDKRILFLNHKKYMNLASEPEACLPYSCLPLNTFEFSEDGILSGIIPELRDTIKIIYGYGLHVTANGARSSRNELLDINSVPWDYPGSGIAITEMNSDGTLRIVHDNQDFTLGAGKTKAKTTMRSDSSEGCIITETTTDSLTNYGFLYPWQIQLSPQSEDSSQWF